MRYLQKFMAALAIVACTLLSTASAQTYSGIVSVDTVEATAGGQIGVPVRLSNNNMPISGLVVPLKFSSPYLTADSVSFVGSMLPADFAGHRHIDAANSTIKILYMAKLVSPTPTITATDGTLATIFFSVSAAAPEGTIPIDSINIDSVIHFDTSEVHIHTRIEACDQSGMVLLLPSFIPGGITVKSATGVDDGLEPSGLPASFNLSQNYPNPFNPSTVIEFALPQASQVRLEVFNILGQKVRTLIDTRLSAGNHRVEFDGTSLTSGIYFYRLSHDGKNLTRKMTLIK